MSAALRIIQRTRDDTALVASYILGRPKSTARIYRSEVEAFLRWLNKSAHHATANDLRGFIESCRRQELKPSTIHRKIVIVKSFYAFLTREGELRQDPLQHVEIPACPPPGKPRGLTPEDLKLFLSKLTGISMASLRDRGIFALMAGTGLRISEVCGLSIRDISEADEKGWKALRIIGKGQREREVHVSPEIFAIVLAYLQRRTDELTDTAPVFVSFPRGIPIKAVASDRRISVSSIYSRFKRLLTRAGLSEDYSPHSLRHTFASSADAAGASVEAIRIGLGHQNLSTSQRYLNRMRRGINEAFEKVRLPSM